MAIFLILPITCIWFSEEMGTYTGVGFGRGAITSTTPACLAAFGGLAWTAMALLTEEVVTAGFAALVFCWVGGLFAQAVIDLPRGARSRLFRKMMCQWIVGIVTYYVAAGFLVYWIESHIHGAWAFLLGLIIMMLPLARVLPHLPIENARRKEKSANNTSDGFVNPRMG